MRHLYRYLQKYLSRMKDETMFVKLKAGYNSIVDLENPNTGEYFNLMLV